MYMREPVVQNNVSKFDLGFGLYSNNASVVHIKTVYIHNITATVQYHLVSSLIFQSLFFENEFTFWSLYSSSVPEQQNPAYYAWWWNIVR